MRQIFATSVLTAMIALGCARRPRSQAATEVAPLDAQRIVVSPTELAVVSPRNGGSALPAEIPLGSTSAGSVMILLRFPTPWGNRVRIARAFLVLEASPGAIPEPHPVSVSVARILERWSASQVSWSRLPKLSPAEARAVAVTAPPGPLRIDVTAIVERWTRERADDQGIALTAPPDAPVGATYSTGISGAPGPRLDVYLR
jgi:hypothetical protein